MAHRQRDIIGGILIFLLLAGFWLLLSATLHWQHLLVGTVLALLLTAAWSKIQIGGGRRTAFTFKQLGFIIFYLLCLIWEILKANIMVALIVLDPRLPISPGIVITRHELKHDLTRALYANSITLTPGTITVDLESDRLVVHAITAESGRGVLDWYLYKQAKKLEGEGG